MKHRNRLSIVLMLALGVSWLGCNKSGKLAEPSTTASPTGPVELKMKWPAGERSVQDIDMKMKMEISMASLPQPMKQDMTMGQQYGMTVLKDTPDGGHEIELEFLSMRMGMSMGDKKMMDYDSSKTMEENKANPAAGIFKKIVGAKIRFFLNASNEVDHLEGAKELFARLATGADSAAFAPLKSMFNEDYMKQMMSQNRYLPSKPVQVNDTWPVQIEYPMGPMGTLVMDYTFTLQGWEKHGQRNCAHMDFTGTMKMKPDSKASMMGMSITSMDGTSSGKSWFDPDLGKIIETDLNQDITMVMNVPGRAGAMQTMTNQMNQTMDLKLVSVK